jgi:hypothetical protein
MEMLAAFERINKSRTRQQTRQQSEAQSAAQSREEFMWQNIRTLSIIAFSIRENT